MRVAPRCPLAAGASDNPGRRASFGRMRWPWPPAQLDAANGRRGLDCRHQLQPQMLTLAASANAARCVPAPSAGRERQRQSRPPAPVSEAWALPCRQLHWTPPTAGADLAACANDNLDCRRQLQPQVLKLVAGANAARRPSAQSASRERQRQSRSPAPVLGAGAGPGPLAAASTRGRRQLVLILAACATVNTDCRGLLQPHAMTRRPPATVPAASASDSPSRRHQFRAQMLALAAASTRGRRRQILAACANPGRLRQRWS